MKISNKWFKRSLCSKASARKPKMAVCGKTLGRSVLKSSWSCLHKMRFFYIYKRMYVSFIFSLAERTQRWFNFPEFKEHFIHKKTLFSILYWKTLNFVSTVTIAGKGYIDFQLRSKLLKSFIVQMRSCFFVLLRNLRLI